MRGIAAKAAWLARYRRQIRSQLDRMRRRDLDGDGLIESPHRLGISGQHQWSTNWWDVISFGWKDAFTNAILYPALIILAEQLPRLGQPALARGLAAWAAKLRSNFVPTFFNAQTGWLAGWRCKRNKLHDHAYLFVNGAAVCGGLVDDALARAMIRRLWDEMHRLGAPDFRMGLPGNLWNVPGEDMAIRMPEGIYENKSLTHSQSRHFVAALYRVGMTREADRVLGALLETLGTGTAFGGCGTGVDWRRWDGVATGYEGLLSDQFGILAVAMERYARCRVISDQSSVISKAVSGCRD